LLVPNAVFLVAIALGIGTPQRFAAIVAYLVVALLARHLSWGWIVAAYLVVLIYDLVSTVSLLFGLSFLEMFHVIQFAAELQLFASAMYAAIAVGLGGSTVVALWILVHEQQELRQARLAPPLFTVVGLIALDIYINSMPHYHFGTAFAAGNPFASAMQSSGLAKRLDAHEQKDILVVMVEGLGVFSDSKHQAVLDASFDTPELNARYRVERGRTAYYGSTTAAEMRELCATRTSYTSVIEGDKIDCIPLSLSAQGYQTLAVHGFSKNMFQRNIWYPRIGFQNALFDRDFEGQGLPMCGAVFRGVCDTAIAARLGQYFDDAKRPLFLYWLTLNTHIPIAPGEHSGKLDCRAGGAFEDGEVCDMAGMWVDLFDRISDLALARTDLDILIVGDHAPPMWSRRQRTLFEPGAVPWVRISAKESASR